MTRKGLMLMAGALLLLMMVPGSAQAQTTSSSNIPVLASGQMPTPVPGEDVKLANVFQGSLGVGAYYDSNAEIGSVPRKWDVGYGISPSVAFRETLPRLDWSLMYAPGFTISQNLNYRNQFTQNFGGQFTWRVSRHGTLAAAQNYIRATDPFQQFTVQPGPTVAPNQTIYLPSFLRTSILSNAEFSYQTSTHTAFGLGGSFDRERNDSIPHSGPTSTLIISQTATGNAFIAHRFSERNQLGFHYLAQVLRFPSQDARTTTHSFLVSEELDFSPRTSLTLYGGPEYSLTSNQLEVNLFFFIITIPVQANQWNASGGAIYSWTGQRLAAVVDYRRAISDGGGLVGAVNLNSGMARLSWRMTPRWSLTTSIAAADNQLLAVENRPNEMKIYSAEIGLSRQFSRNVSMNLSYERLNQTGALAGLPVGNHDLASASIVYSFLKPLGR